MVAKCFGRCEEGQVKFLDNLFKIHVGLSPVSDWSLPTMGVFSRWMRIFKSVAVLQAGFNDHFVYTAGDIHQPHAGAKTKLSDFFAGCGETRLKCLVNIFDAWAIIDHADGNGIRLNLHADDTAIGSVDNEVHFGFVDSDTASPGKLRGGAKGAAVLF